MTTGQTTESLFRRRRRWPWIALALVLVAGVGAVVGATVLDDGRRARTSSAPAGTPAPTATPSSDPEPTETPEPAPSPEPSPGPTDGTSPDPTDAPSASATPGAPTGSPTPASPTPLPTRTPGPSATSAGYPPPGMRLQVVAEHVGANRARIRVRVTDTDGTWNGGYVDFGDGTSRQFPQSTPSCSTPPPAPYQPAPSDRTVDVLHDYPAKGTYDVFVRVRTDRPCHGTPVEEASRVVTVTVDDATPGPTPTPILTPPAVP